MSREALPMTDKVRVRLYREGGKYMTPKRVIKIKGIEYTLKRIGNVQIFSLAGIRDPGKMIATLMTLTIRKPKVTINHIDQLDPEVFYKLLEEVMDINEFQKLMKYAEQFTEKFRPSTESKTPQAPKYVA